MSTETCIALDCPYCKEAIYEPLSWFKQTYSTCPYCEQGLSAGQFEESITDLEQAMEESVKDLIYGLQGGGCCGKKSSSGCGCG